MQIGLSLCLGANLRSGGASFSPASLFADGDGALIQRRSDAFFVENTASTHAVDTNAVGFATDGSEGAGYAAGAWSGLGAELVTNGGFDTDLGGWTLQSGWTWDAGRARLVASSVNTSLTQNVATASGETCVVSYDVIELDSGRIQPSAVGTIPAATASGAYNFAFKANSSSTGLGFRNTFATDTQAILDNASLKPLPGTHLTQATTSYKPSLQTGGLLFDGNDDRLTGAPAPTTSGTIAARFNGSTASRVIFGSQAASEGRCFLALDASGKIAAGIGAQGTSTITGGVDIRDEWHTAAVTWDGSTVTLYLDGVSVYSAAQSGAVNTTVAMMLGALNANGTAAAFWAGTVSDALVIDRVLTTDEITNLNTYWSA